MRSAPFPGTTRKSRAVTAEEAATHMAELAARYGKEAADCEALAEVLSTLPHMRTHAEDARERAAQYRRLGY